MRRSTGLVLLSLLAAACNGPAGLGDSEHDTVMLKDVPALAHVAAALEDGNDQKVMDLFGKRKLAFDRAPDPSSLLQSFLVQNESRVHEGGVLLSMLTYNVALLSVRPLGIYKYAESPELDVRREVLPDLILREGADIVVLQEVWLDEDLPRFEDAASRHGYRLFKQDRSEYDDGLLVLLKNSIVSPDMEPELENVPYDSQDPKEGLPTIGIKRGFLRVSFRHPSLGAIHVYDTHMQAYPEAWSNRMQQARQLGLHLREHVKDGEVGLVGGDMNAGPYYRDDVWHGPDGDVEDWWSNALSYPLLLHYGGAVDLFSMGQEAQDVHLGNTVVNDAEMSTKIPGAAEGWCAANPAVVFTATDCNSLYFRQYAGTEYPARLDHLVARDTSARIHVVGTGLMFTRAIEFPGEGTFEMSDHFGVLTSLSIRP